MDVLANSVSSGSQYRGQKSCSSSPKRHVLIEPPRRPCTKTRSIRGSGAQNKDLRPSGPFVSSLALACGRADPKLRVKKEASLRMSPAGGSWCTNVGVFSVGDSVGASERDEENTSVCACFERQRFGRSYCGRHWSADNHITDIKNLLPSLDNDHGITVASQRPSWVTKKGFKSVQNKAWAVHPRAIVCVPVRPVPLPPHVACPGWHRKQGKALGAPMNVPERP
jgi:hypothetical protein